MVLTKATRQVTEWTFSSPKVPACFSMEKINLASRKVIRRHAKEIGDANLARRKLQKERPRTALRRSMISNIRPSNYRYGVLYTDNKYSTDTTS
uniref:Uncharacterized protein n=1 Tax=Solanum tuberosum TaxID=4113 RepID=M1DWZ7_SOLTU